MTKSECVRMYYLTNEMENVIDSIRYARMRAENCTTTITATGSHASGKRDSLADRVAYIVYLNDKLNELRTERNALLDKLNAETSGDGKTALKMRYLYKYTWTTIGERLGLNRQVARYRAMKCLEAEDTPES